MAAQFSPPPHSPFPIPHLSLDPPDPSIICRSLAFVPCCLPTSCRHVPLRRNLDRCHWRLWLRHPPQKIADPSSVFRSCSPEAATDPVRPGSSFRLALVHPATLPVSSLHLVCAYPSLWVLPLSQRRPRADIKPIPWRHTGRQPLGKTPTGRCTWEQPLCVRNTHHPTTCSGPTLCRHDAVYRREPPGWPSCANQVCVL
jgi:hypothetical protein